MPSFSAAFTTANAPYNIWDVIAGVQTTGVTPRTGSKTGIAPAKNWSRLEVFVDASVAGIVFITSDPTASGANKVGVPIPSGTSKIYQGEGHFRAISLPEKWFSPDTTGMIVHIDYEG